MFLLQNSLKVVTFCLKQNDLKQVREIRKLSLSNVKLDFFINLSNRNCFQDLMFVLPINLPFLFYKIRISYNSMLFD